MKSAPIQAQPLVSVVIATYNHGPYLVKALRCLLAQTYSNIEIIVVNDASPDNTNQLVHQNFERELEQGRVKYVVNEQNLGQLKSRDRGAAIAQGEVLLFCDSDELYTPNHVEAMLAELQKGYDCVNQHTTVRIDEQDNVTERRTKGFPGSFEFKLFLFGLTGGDIMVTKAAFEQSGGFAPVDLKYGEDWAFLVHLHTNGYAVNLVQTHTTLHREHTNTLTHQFDWHKYRLEKLFPYVQAKYAAGELTRRQYAIFVFGTCFNAPFAQIPGYLARAFTLAPLLPIREPALYVYLWWNLGRRLRRRLK